MANRVGAGWVSRRMFHILVIRFGVQLRCERIFWGVTSDDEECCGGG